METIEVVKLIPHPDNDKYFDDITGDNWTEFLKSVQTSGVIEPIVISQNYMIVSGHQRVRACKELKIKEVNCRVKIYEPTEQWTVEDVILKELLETNLRQRGIGNTNPIKLARCITTLEKLYGIEHGGDRKSKVDNPPLKTQKELADDIGVSQDQLKAYKKILTLIPDLQDLVESGELKATTAYKVWGKLSQDEQKDFLDRLGDEKVISMSGEDTKKEIEKLKAENKKLQSQLDNPVEATVIDNTDYEAIETLKLENKQLKNQEPIIKEVEIVPSDYEQIKQQLETISKEKDDLQLQLNSTDNKSETPQQFTATSFIHSIERFGDYCYHFGAFLKKQDNVTQEQAEGYLHYVEMAKKNIKVLEDSVKEFVEGNTDISAYVVEDELDWNELMQETVPEKEPEENLPESIRMTREMMKDEFDDDIEDEPVAPTIELQSDKQQTDDIELIKNEFGSLDIIVPLIGKYPNLILSKIYENEDDQLRQLAYKNLEQELGLCDEQGNLLLDYSIYKDFMLEYEVAKHNRIGKRIKKVLAQQNI